MRLNHNMASLNIYREHTRVLQRQGIAMERISSGLKINSAKDNSVKIASSERMRMQIRGLQMAQRNAQDGISMLQTADGALDTITSMLQRVRELTVKSGSGTNSEGDTKEIQNEINEMLEGISSIAKDTQFNNVSLLNAKEGLNESYNNNDPSKILSMPVGANSGEKVDIPIFDMSIENLGDESKSLSDLYTKGNQLGGLENLGTDESLSIIDGAIDMVVRARSKYGALENRFESTYNRIGEMHDKIAGAESEIRDADMAEEMMNLARDNILIDSGNAMMAQSNKFPRDILGILENVKSR